MAKQQTREFKLDEKGHEDRRGKEAKGHLRVKTTPHKKEAKHRSSADRRLWSEHSQRTSERGAILNKKIRMSPQERLPEIHTSVYVERHEDREAGIWG